MDVLTQMTLDELCDQLARHGVNGHMIPREEPPVVVLNAVGSEHLLVLKVTTYATDAEGQVVLDGGEPAYEVRYIPIASLYLA